MDELGTECERLNAMMGLYLNARKCFIICVVQDRTFIAPQDSPTIKMLPRSEGRASPSTLFDRDRAFVDSDFGVFHDSSGADRAGDRER